jgi:hypothetical protein
MEKPTKLLNESQELRKTASDTFDRIYNNFFNPKAKTKLTPKEKEVMERWDFSWKMLAAMYTQRQVVEALVQKFGVNKSIAYDDVGKAMMLFGDPRNSNKEAKRLMAEEWLIKGIKKAWDDGDLDAYERMVGRYSKLNKLEDENENGMEEMLKLFKAVQVNVVSNMSDLQAEAEKLREQITIDIPHAEG